MKKLVLILFLFRMHSMASASCGSASCPLNAQHFLGEGMFQFGYAYEYINQDQIYVGSKRSFVGAIPEHHDEVQTINASNTLQLQYGVTDAFSFGVEMPFIHREHAHIHHHQGEDLWESWNFGALGDMRIMSQIDAFNSMPDGDRHLALIAGIKLPTGVVDMKNAEGEEAEVGIQPGTGSTDGIVGVNFRQTLCSVPTLTGEYSALPLMVGARYQFNGKGTDDWRFGNSVIASLGTAYQFVRKATVSFQVNGRFQGYADVGQTEEPRENTGGTWIFATPGVSVQIDDAFTAYSYVQLPVYQNVHGIQQTSRVNLQFGITADVNLLQ